MLADAKARCEALLFNQLASTSFSDRQGPLAATQRNPTFEAAVVKVQYKRKKETNKLAQPEQSCITHS